MESGFFLKHAIPGSRLLGTKTEAQASETNRKEGMYVLVMWKVRFRFSLMCMMRAGKMPVQVDVLYTVKVLLQITSTM